MGTTVLKVLLLVAVLLCVVVAAAPSCRLIPVLWIILMPPTIYTMNDSKGGVQVHAYSSVDGRQIESLVPRNLILRNTDRETKPSWLFQFQGSILFPLVPKGS